MSEAEQAAYFRDLFALRRVIWRDYVDALFLYSLQDYHSSDGSGSFGVLRENGSRKPAWSAVRPRPAPEAPDFPAAAAPGRGGRP